MKILGFLLAISCAHASYFRYANVHAMGGYPMVGIGLRAQNGLHSVDFSGNACPANPPDSLRIFHLKGLYLFQPTKVKLYFGAGLGFLNEPQTIGLSGSLESAFGFQWDRMFLEINGIVPFKQNEALIPVIPGLTYGLGF